MPAQHRLFERLLQVNVAIVVVLGILMLGMGQRDLRLGLLAVIATATSLFLTDIMRWVQLNRTLANIAALVAVGFAVADFFRFESDTQLLAIANLLIYLQCVLLFQQKHLRVYWQILVLSLLQVVVGAALNMGAMFGLLMVIYMLLMLSASMLLFIRHEVARRQQADLFEDSSTTTNPPFLIPPLDVPQSWSWTDRQVVLLPAVDHDSIGQLLHAGLVVRLLKMGIGTLLVSAAVFFCVPRFGSSMWQPLGLSAQRTVGFTSSVSLGSLGEVSENPEVVMRVEYLRRDVDAPYKIEGEPLFRGSVLDNYRRGEWTFVRRRFSRARGGLPPPPPDSPFMVRQRITIEPLDEPVLFGIYPLYQTREENRNRKVRFEYDTKQLIRIDGSQSERLSYELLTGGLLNGRQRPVVPEVEPMQFAVQYKQLLQLPYTVGTQDRYGSVQGSQQRAPDVNTLDDLPELAATTSRLVEAAKLDIADPEYQYTVAKLLERHFLTARYSYSLQPQARDLTIDPIEDFIKNNPRGHCEYYASALTLMLRTQGIPARMVVGFKGGEYNTLGSFYQVRQLHAHTWVEAYLEPDQIPEAERDLNFPNTPGWLTLDPTPAAADTAEFDEQSWLNTIANMGDYLQSLWSTYVVGLNAERQQDVIYGPLADIADHSTVIEMLSALPGRVWQILQDWRNWFRPRSIAVILLAALTLYGLLKLTRFIVRRLLVRIGQRVTKSRRKPSTVDFYDRLEQLLARNGLVRSNQQTPLEFALATGAELVADDESRPYATLPRRIVEAYYRVRFGRQALDSHEAQAVEQQLAHLEATLDRLQAKRLLSRLA